MIKIERQKLLEELAEFARQGHGVIIGKPGVGKTYTLRELKNALIPRGILTVYLPIDTLIEANDDEITRELGTPDNWIETFKKADISGAKSILIFDAFDAARDEELRKNVLKQIRRAKAELSSHWHIIVSVRTYDSIKSPDLLKLFPWNGSGPSATARSFTIPALDDDELDSILVKSPVVAAAYKEAKDSLKAVLHIPYFLRLFNEIIETLHGHLSDIRVIESETQLLSKYWNKKIIEINDTSNAEQLLTAITELLVTERKLTIPKADFYRITNTNQTPVFNYLRSENILEEYGNPMNRIGYSHNILFDYAVCRLLLSDDFSALHNFIKKDRTRPFFLRPSFIYFFTHLWYEARATFWEVYQKLRTVTEKGIELGVRLIPNSIIASEFKLIQDLEPLLSNHNGSERNELIKELLQSIIFLRLERPTHRDAILIIHLSTQLDISFLWEVSVILQRVIDKIELFDEIKNGLGASARSLLTFIFQHRNDDKIVNKSGWNRLGSIRGIGLVSLTYTTDVDASKALLKTVLQIIKEPNFDISYIAALVDNVKLLTPLAPQFVSEIYLEVYGYVETSDNQTSMGGGVQLNLLSNRRQDYQMCQYSLGEYYPSFVEMHPTIAIPVALAIANRYDRYILKDTTKERVQFFIDKKAYIFVHDYSFVGGTWDEQSGNPKKMVISIFEFFEKLLTPGNEANLKELITLYMDNAQSGFSWAKLISFGCKYPEQMMDILYPLCQAPILLTSSETVYAIADFIGLIASKLPSVALLQLENNVLAILDLPEDETNGSVKSREQRVSRLLNKLPVELVQTERAKQFLADKKRVPNDPLVIYHSSVEAVTTESWLEDENVDIHDPLHAEILDKRKALEIFNNEWRNDRPSREEYAGILPVVDSLFDLIMKSINQADHKVITTALIDIAKTYSIICRQIETLSEEEFKMAGIVLLSCYHFQSEFDHHEVDSSPAGGYSPTPRTEAAEALSYLAIRSEEPFLNIYIAATSDKNSIVRFNSLKDLKLIKQKYGPTYWEIIFSSLRTEPHSFTAAILLDIAHAYSADQANVEKAIGIANERTDLLYERSSFTEMFVWLLLSGFARQNETATKILGTNVTRPAVAKQLVFKVCEAIDPGFPHNDYSKDPEKNEALFQLFSQILHTWGKIMIETTDVNQKDKTQAQIAVEIFDSAIQQIYFSLSLRNSRRRDRMTVSENNRFAFYLKIKPSLRIILDMSKNTTVEGMLLPHTAYYFSQILNGMLSQDTRDILSMTLEITKYSFNSGYTFDPSSVEQMVNLVEKIFADHRALLLETESFNNLVDLLNYYVKSGWPRAVELLWRLDDIFR
jgi:hypothetical protein